MQDEDTISITGGPLQPHEYVLIKAEMTAGDETWIQNHAARTRGGGKGKSQDIVFLIGDVKLATAQRLIKGWVLSRQITRPDGQKERIAIPYDLRAIENLPSIIYRFILKKIDELNPEDEESDDDFLPDVVDSSEENFQSERIYHLKGS